MAETIETDMAPKAHSSHNHRACVADAMARAKEICVERGAKLTPLREQVLQIVWRSHKPIGAYEVLDALSATHKSARPPTVYRALDFLMAEGLIHKIESLNAYLGCTDAGAPHSGQFLICRQCGGTEEIVDAKLERVLDAAATRAGFKAEHKTVEITGLCAHCAG